REAWAAGCAGWRSVTGRWNALRPAWAAGCAGWSEACRGVRWQREAWAAACVGRVRRGPRGARAGVTREDRGKPRGGGEWGKAFARGDRCVGTGAAPWALFAE